MNISEYLAQKNTIQTPFAALIGERTDYSVSPLMHNKAAKELDIPFFYFGLAVKQTEFELVKEVVQHPLCRGINITIPYKEKILAFADDVSEQVWRLNASNVLVKQADGSLRAENTDVYGFIEPIREIIKANQINQAIIFGTGGASRAAKEGLTQLGIENVKFVSRNPDSTQLSYENWSSNVDLGASLALINGSPLGMTNHRDLSPVSLMQLEMTKPTLCYDLIYNPTETLFLKWAKQVGTRFIFNGLEMLIHQGSEAFRLWNGVPFPIYSVKEEVKKSSILNT